MALAGGAVAYCSAPCPGGSGRSQDALAILPTADGGALLAIADGMGGLPGGGEASASAVGVLAEAAAMPPTQDGVLRPRIIDAIERINQEILATGTGAATTLAVVEIGRDFIRPYHVGDSEIMVFGRLGRVKYQSVPHSPVGFAYHAGMLDEDQAISHEDRHLVSNVLGTREMRIEMGSPLPLAPGDCLVVCSDGLVDNLQFSEISDSLRVGRLDRCFQRLVADTLERMAGTDPGRPSKPDDLSVIAFRPQPGARVRQRLAHHAATLAAGRGAGQHTRPGGDAT
jgi:serine/threonine protein phosphatase PrpC